MKTQVTSAPILTLATDEGQFKIEANASDYASGAVLSQYQKSSWHPIGFYSKGFSPTERNYKIHNKEMLAIIYALDEWRHLVQGSKDKIEIWTDYKNLEYFLSAQRLNRHQACWSALLADYNFMLKHKPGKMMLKLDALSCWPDHKDGMDNDNDGVTLISAKHITYLHTNRMAVLLTDGDAIVNALQKRGPAVENPKDKDTVWKVVDGLMTYNRLIVIDDEDIKHRVLKLHHDSQLSGHPGQFRTWELITQNYWWPHLTQYINLYVDGCRKCQVTKIFPQKPWGLLSPNAIPFHPFEIISVNFITSLSDLRGHDAIMVVINWFSKCLYIIPCNKEINSEGAAWIFRDHVWQHEGLPKIVISDCGGQFASKFTGELYKLLSISRNMLTAHHPQTDGQTEGINQEIEQYLQLFFNYHIDDWTEWLPLAEFSYNNKASSAMGKSPFFVNKGCEVNSSTALTYRNEHIESYEEFALCMQKVHEETKSALKGAADNMKRFYNRKHKFEEFAEGEKVYLNADHIVTGWPKKLLDWKWLGPFSIIKKVSPTVYKLQLPATWHMHPVFHILKLRHVKEDDFNQPVPKVTLNVHGENWALEKVLASQRKNNLNEYLVRWKDQAIVRSHMTVWTSVAATWHNQMTLAIEEGKCWHKLELNQQHSVL